MRVAVSTSRTICALALAVVAGATTAMTATGTSSAAAEPTLKYVVILSRHGVRSPSWTRERLNDYSATPWPDFGVPPGNLTAQGYRLMTLMGGFYRQWMIAHSLLPPVGCAAAPHVTIRADIDQRTLETGRALASATLPGCAVKLDALPIAQGQGEDPLFDPIEARAVSVDGSSALRAVADRVGPNQQQYLQARAAAFHTLDQILTGGGTAKEMPFRSPKGFELTPTEGFPELASPLATASTLTENLLLEYANGVPRSELGWGRLNAQNLEQILQLHADYADLMRRTPHLARARGLNLLGHVLNSLEQSVSGRPVAGAFGTPTTALLVIVGHDTNLSNVSGMLGLSWKVPGYPRDDTPPGGALVFSVWQETGADTMVKLQYVVQTPDQMHDAAPLTLAAPPAIADVQIPGCGTVSAGCPWSTFVNVIGRAIDHSAYLP